MGNCYKGDQVSYRTVEPRSKEWEGKWALRHGVKYTSEGDSASQTKNTLFLYVILLVHTKGKYCI
jgi:hypothetical protein